MIGRRKRGTIAAPALHAVTVKYVYWKFESSISKRSPTSGRALVMDVASMPARKEIKQADSTTLQRRRALHVSGFRRSKVGLSDSFMLAGG